MSTGSPFRESPSQADRQTRRAAASPYRRPSSRARAPDTPSRLSGILASLFSPFRSASKRVEPIDDESDGDGDNDGDGDGDGDGEWEQPAYEFQGGHEDEERKPDLPLLGRRQDSFDDGSAPPSPTPHTPPSAQSQYMASMSETTPRAFEAPASPQRVLDDLMDDRRRAGNPPLTPIQQDHIQRLMDAIRQSEQVIPSAFTPNFRASSQQPAFRASPSLNSIFAHSPAKSGSASGTPFRRKRPLYVGAGYSSQSARRRATDSLKRSQSEGGLFQPDSPVVEDGKRRKVDDSPLHRSATDGYLAESSKAAGQRSATQLAQPVVPAKPTPLTTPARPSPLWQVSKADTPSPSPPKRQTFEAPPRPPTRAADLMMDIIRQEDETKPKATREAIVNPYDNADNPVARIPRSRPPRVAAPRKVVASKAGAKAPAKEISPLEQLERSMPPEYKQEAKRARPSPASPAPAPTPAAGPKKDVPAKKFKKPIEVVELSDSDDDDEAATAPASAPAPTPAPAPKAKRVQSNIRPAATTIRPSLSPQSTTPLPTFSLPPPSPPPFAFTVTGPPAPSSASAPSLSLFSSASRPLSPTSIEAGPTKAPSDAEARQEARYASRAVLPAFSFAGAVARMDMHDDGDDAVRDVARVVPRGELPVFVL